MLIEASNGHNFVQQEPYPSYWILLVSSLLLAIILLLVTYSLEIPAVVLQALL